jgi:hypothetical protein
VHSGLRPPRPRHGWPRRSLVPGTLGARKSTLLVDARAGTRGPLLSTTARANALAPDLNRHVLGKQSRPASPGGPMLQHRSVGHGLTACRRKPINADMVTSVAQHERRLGTFARFFGCRRCCIYELSLCRSVA